MNQVEDRSNCAKCAMTLICQVPGLHFGLATCPSCGNPIRMLVVRSLSSEHFYHQSNAISAQTVDIPKDKTLLALRLQEAIKVCPAQALLRGITCPVTMHGKGFVCHHCWFTYGGSE